MSPGSTPDPGGTPTAPDHDHHELEDHDRGLSQDLPVLLSRRRALTLFGGAGLAAALAGCGLTGNGDGGSSGTAGGSSGSEIPEETSGPYPGDGSNGVNVLTESGIVRSDITRSFGSASGVAEGVPLTLRLRVLDVSKRSAGFAGAAVYVWHCDQTGRYSLYSDGVTEENYLRGVQPAGADGWVTFRSIYPAAYSGRWPHVHFEVYPDLGAATTARDKLRTSQLGLPAAACTTVYETSGYRQSLQNMAHLSLDTDVVFRDGYSHQLATVTGNERDGMTATLEVPV